MEVRKLSPNWSNWLVYQLQEIQEQKPKIQLMAMGSKIWKSFGTQQVMFSSSLIINDNRMYVHETNTIAISGMNIRLLAFDDCPFQNSFLYNALYRTLKNPTRTFFTKSHVKNTCQGRLLPFESIIDLRMHRKVVAINKNTQIRNFQESLET